MSKVLGQQKRTLKKGSISIAGGEPQRSEGETPGTGSVEDVCHKETYFLLLTIWQTDARNALAMDVIMPRARGLTRDVLIEF